MSISYNHCNLPPWVIASRYFNENPRHIEIMGVRAGNRFLFEKLRQVPSADERAVFFNDYMSVKFQLHQWESQSSLKARKSIRNSYLRFLRGWGMESNSVEGAVLKGWVESRIGLPPTFHRLKIPSVHSEEYLLFAVDRTKGSERTNAINSQLDLLFEYSQFDLAQRHPGERWLTLYRGVTNPDEHEVLETVSKREQYVRLNNLSSFTSDMERAWEFGYTVWQARVPLSKIFFFNALLPNSILKGEDEFMVIGGDYRVRKVTW